MDTTGQMRTVEEQMAVITASAMAPEPVRIAISEALGLRSAEQVDGTRPLPGFDQAAIDGFAIRAVDVKGAEDEIFRLPITGEVSAGSHRPVRLQPRQAVRVQTGAPLPTLADAVIPLDWVELDGRRMEPLRSVVPGQFVHRKGSDVQPGDVVVEEGAVIGAAQVGLLAAVGRSKVLVYPKPRMSVILSLIHI